MFNFFGVKSRIYTAAVLIPVIALCYLGSVAVAALSTGAFLAKLRSPAQVDRAPVLEEKIFQAVQDIENLMASEDVDIRTAYVDLLKSKSTSKLLRSFREQTMTWIEQKKTGQTSFEYPLSPKQMAWMIYLLYPGRYENPRANKDLYPNG